MNKAALMVLMQEMQKQNLRLKDDIHTVRKQLHDLEDVMMKELKRVDKGKVLYQTPLQCLIAFVDMLQTNLFDFSKKNHENELLRDSLRVAESQAKELTSKLQSCMIKFNQNQKQHQAFKLIHKDREESLKVELLALNNINQQLKYQYEEQVKLNDQMTIKMDQQKRVAIAAVVHSSRQEMIEYRASVEKEFQNQSAKLRDQIKVRDESFKKLARDFQKIDIKNESDSFEASKMKQIIKTLVKFDELNNTIAALREEVAQCKKQVKDSANKKLSVQIRLNDMKTQLMNHESALVRKDKDIFDLRQHLQKVFEQLALEKKDKANLQKYYEEKWNSEFQNVKRNLEKNYNQKILEHEKDLQFKKGEVNRKILSYVFIHEEDQKKMEVLSQTIRDRDRITKHLQQIIKNWQQKLQDEKNIIRESNQMMIEEELSLKQQLKSREHYFQHKIKKLQVKNTQLLSEGKNTSIAIQSSIKKVQQKFQLEISQIVKVHQNKIIQLQNVAQLQKQSFEQQKIKIHDSYRQKEAVMKNEFVEETVQMKKKLQLTIEQKSNQLQEQKHKYQQFVIHSLSNEKRLKKELLQLRHYYQMKIKDLEQQIRHKAELLESENDKSENDLKLKKELRQLLEQKMRELKQLMEQKQELQNELQAKESEINHLSHQLAEYKFTRDDWIRLTNQLRDQFLDDFRAANSIHQQQITNYKSRIWQLQNIILRRAIRPQDEVRIKSLSEQNKQLESKIQIKEAQNGVLKQIKHYYQIQNDCIRQKSEAVLNNSEMRRAPSMLIATRKPKKMRIKKHEMTRSDAGQDEQLVDDIKTMKRYILSRCQKTEFSGHKGKEDEHIKFKTLYNQRRSVLGQKQ